MSLAKGYGGTEEALQPYTPLQVAPLEFLDAGDIEGLRRWIDRHIPLLAQLIRPEPLTYLDFMRDLNRRLYADVERDLSAWNRWEVLGRRALARRQPGWRLAVAATRPGAMILALRARLFGSVFDSFFVSRFVTSQLDALRRRIRPFPLEGMLLSVCCGHGPFELLASARNPAAEIVSLDGQLLNLFVTRRFVHPDGDYICYDVQFPLPFADGSYAAAFSSSCLTEIPTQASFIREMIRVSSPAGWTLFDAVTPEPGVRVVPTRFYQVRQNSLSSMREYFDLFVACAGGRTLPMTSARAVEPWSRDPDAIATLPSGMFAVTSLPLDGGTSAPVPGELARLCVNPKYDVRNENGHLAGQLRFSQRLYARLHPDLTGPLPERIDVETARLKDPDYVSRLCEEGVLVLLPGAFGADVVRAFL